MDYNKNNSHKKIKVPEFKQLKILEINVNSIIANSRRYNLMQFLVNNKIDIALINETKLKNNHKISFKNYSITRNDRVKDKGGGTAIIIKRSNNFESINLACQSRLRTLEKSVVKIPLHNNISLFLISAYAPGSSRSDYASDLNDIFEELRLNSFNNYYLLAGDLNSRHKTWDDQIINSRGASLVKWLNINQFKYRAILLSPTVPTYHLGNSYIDRAIHDTRIEIKNKIDNKCDVLPYDNDHNAL